LSRIWFVAAPASVSLLFLATPISKAIAFGEMHRANGIHFLAAAIASLAIALIGASTNEFARQACYARRDVVAPLLGGAALVVVTLVTIPFALTLFHGAAALAALGVVVTVGELTRSIFVNRAALRGTPAERGSLRPLVRHLMVALATIGPPALVARIVDHALGGRIGALAALALGVGGGLVAYAVLQAVVRAPEVPASVLRSPRRVPIAAREKSGR
jgi:peptidoglycan biosynthesis protein MviN/MurJ (putative lipid II flippase)